MKSKDKLEPVVFSITDPEDLQELQLFKKNHKKCREIHPDVTGALLSYTVIPTGFGLAWTVKCSCGEKLVLCGDMR